MERRVLSEAIQESLGDRRVTALLFATHDLEPGFFEQYVLPVFLGDDYRHNRRVQQVQLDYTIREREIPIDVFYEHSALVAADGSACLGWTKHPMHGRTGRFHPKVVLALCKDDAGLESLVVSVASANLTASGWWRNVECADVVRLEDGARHGYVAGLRNFVDLLSRRRSWRLNEGVAASLPPIKAFLARLSDDSNTHVAGHLVPQLLPGFDDLPARLRAIFGSRLDDAHLEVISPFFDRSAAAALSRVSDWRDTFKPRSFKVMAPVRDGVSTIEREIFDALDASDAVTWAKLPAAVVRSASAGDARERSTHAKVYRFWRRRPDPIEVIVLGSHNFTGPAQSGSGNWEASVIVEPDEPHLSHVLEDSSDRPGAFREPDDDLGVEGDEDVPYIPISVSYDWKSKTARAHWYGREPAAVSLLRAGLEVCRVELTDQSRVELGQRESSALAEVLRVSALLVCRRGDVEAPLLVEELNYDYKPTLLDGLELTPSDIFALWSIPDLRGRLDHLARVKGSRGNDEDDIEFDMPVVGVSMFRRFAGVFQAYASLRKRVDASMKAKAPQKAGLAVYSEQFDAPITVLRLMRESDDADLAHQYVVWRCARLLDRYLLSKYPKLVAKFAEMRAALVDELEHESVIRRRIVSGEDDPQMAAFLDWFDAQFDEEQLA